MDLADLLHERPSAVDNGLGKDDLNAHRPPDRDGRERLEVQPVVDEAVHRCRRPPIRRFDRSAIASNTGCTSVGELAITLRISARGGLPLQRVLRLVEQPHVLDRDDGLVGEGLHQLDMMFAKRTGLCSRRANHADRFTVAQ